VTGWASALLRVHLACAFGATAVFWAAALATKGGSVHRAAGRWFSRLIYAAAVTGGVLAVAGLLAPSMVRAPIAGVADLAALEAARQSWQTLWLVLYVLLIIVAPVQHGLAVVAAGPLPARIRTWPHAGLCLASMSGSVLLLPFIVAWQQVTWLVVAPLGFLIGVRQLSYGARRAATPSEWQREHLTSLITTGVTLHTTLFVFGTSRTLQWHLQGWTAWLPWLLPALVGLPLIAWFRRRYARQPAARS
jgi:hypothetical protein